MQHLSVQRLFKEQIKHYSKKEQSIDSEIIPLALGWLNKKKVSNIIEVCEFGGGSGQLLNEIRRSYPNTKFTSVEIIDDYKPFLVSKKIKYVLGSILDSNFQDDSFDVIIMRDVLHHLIGKNYKETLNNQKLALEELKRLVRPGGVIFVEELTNESEIGTRIIYYLSWLNSKIGVHLSALFISPNVIVAFLTSSKLLNLFYRIFGKNNIKKEITHVETTWYFKLLHLFGDQKNLQ